mgnify:CR=1 FL=1
MFHGYNHHHMKLGTTLALTLAGAILCMPLLAAQLQGNPDQLDGPMTENPKYNKTFSDQKVPANSAPPRSGDESSSDETRLDLSPPRQDAALHSEGGQMGEHAWNPMRAMKDVEVGDFYYKAGNYKAALSRYREALYFKPRDAVATFKLAQTLEKTRQFAEARTRYEEYLAILNDGPSAGQARKALERLKKQ